MYVDRYCDTYWRLYTRDRNVWGGWFLAGNQTNHQNFENSFLTNKLWCVFVRSKQISFFFVEKKIQNGRLKKSAFFKIANSQNFFVKISWIILHFFACFCPYVGQSHNHIGWDKSMLFASINPSNPRTDPWDFHKKILRIGDFEKCTFFESAILNFSSQYFFFAYENQSNL